MAKLKTSLILTVSTLSLGLISGSFSFFCSSPSRDGAQPVRRTENHGHYIPGKRALMEQQPTGSPRDVPRPAVNTIRNLVVSRAPGTAAAPISVAVDARDTVVRAAAARGLLGAPEDCVHPGCQHGCVRRLTEYQEEIRKLYAMTHGWRRVPNRSCSIHGHEARNLERSVPPTAGAAMPEQHRERLDKRCKTAAVGKATVGDHVNNVQSPVTENVVDLGTTGHQQTATRTSQQQQVGTSTAMDGARSNAGDVSVDSESNLQGLPPAVRFLIEKGFVAR